MIRREARRGQETIQPLLTQAPLGFAQWLIALDFAFSHSKEIAIVGTVDSARYLLNVVWEKYRPNQVVALGPQDGQSSIPLLENRTLLNGKETAYVCQNFACELPVTEPNTLAGQLSA